MRMICSALIVNTKNEVLLTERHPKHQLSGITCTPPGGFVDDFTKSFQEEVAREVQEETGLKIQPHSYILFDSQVSSIERIQVSESLKVTYKRLDQHFWNIYLVTGVAPTTKLKPSDDVSRAFWLPLIKVKDYPGLSPESRQLVTRLAREIHG